MAVGTHGNYGLEPGQYAYDAFVHVVQHREVAPDTIREDDIAFALTGMVALGRVALSREDVGAYREWEGHTARFVDGLQDREMGYVPGQFYREVARIRFFGAAAGDIQAADKLHDMLDKDDSYGLDTVMDLCAEHDVMPDAWINQHTETNDRSAGAWATYLRRRRTYAAEHGQELTPADLRTAGSMGYLREFIAGNLSGETTLALATNVYKLAVSVDEKHQVIDRFGLTMSARIREAEEAEEGLRYSDLRFMVDMVDVMASDPEIRADIALDLADLAEREMPKLGDKRTLLDHGKLAIMTAVLRGSDLATVTATIPTFTAYEPHPYNHDRMRDTLLGVAAKVYAARGQHETAATAMATIRNTVTWYATLEAYAKAGGDINLARPAIS
jgi:hypothetical protein